jgi:hypothetical protein
MPIRINLLAEAQALEEMRRRDPVKRAILVGICLVGIVMMWSSMLQVQVMYSKSTLGRWEANLNSHTNDYFQTVNDQAKLASINQRLAALNDLAASRFLESSLLDALQQSTAAGIQIVRLRTAQTYATTEEVKPKKDGRVTTPGKPATSTEKIVLGIDAKDTSPNPGGVAVNKFKSNLTDSAYFKDSGLSTNQILLKRVDAPLVDTESGLPYVLFSFECLYPERTR